MMETEQYRMYDRPPRGPRTYLKWVAVIGLVAAAMVLGVIGMRVLAESVNDLIGGDETEIEAGLDVVVDIEPGSSARQIGDQLSEAGVIDSAAEFERYVRDEGISSSLQAGAYELTTGMGVEAAAAVLVEGPASGDVYRITVIEGLSVSQMLDSIAQQTPYATDALGEVLLNGEVTSTLLQDSPDALSDWEGLLFPDTYEFVDTATPADILGTLARTAEDRVGSIDWSALQARGLTPYDGIIVASMIEREARLDEERAIVASVIYNRLDLGMLLQIDATVLYAIGGGTAVTLEDLEFDSPYNTYRYPGLPPTPIAGPRLASLRAAADPEETDFLYYVLTGTDGSHTFTADFDEFIELQAQARSDGIIP
jgi:UPF0755 protein